MFHHITQNTEDLNRKRPKRAQLSTQHIQEVKPPAHKKLLRQDLKELNCPHNKSNNHHHHTKHSRERLNSSTTVSARHTQQVKQSTHKTLLRQEWNNLPLANFFKVSVFPLWISNTNNGT